MSDAGRERAREQLIRLYRAAVAGANVEQCTSDAVATVPLESRHRVWLFAIGKAAPAMARAAVVQIQRQQVDVAGGIVIAATAEPAPCSGVAVAVGDHPVPSLGSSDAARRLGEFTGGKHIGDVAIVLLSGGASSLMAAPLTGMRDDDLARTFELLLGAGYDIHEMNAIRKRFSRWAAGRLALALAPASIHCFAVSDVPNDDLASIGSGPCVPDPTTVQQIQELLRAKDLTQRLPQPFQKFLSDIARRVAPETPKASHPAFAHVRARVIANNALALQAAASAARALGYDTVVQREPLVGDASAAGARVAASLIDTRARAEPGTMTCVIWGGETTVTLGDRPPAGGRCQELALVAAKQIASATTPTDGITLLAAGTDGRDGQSDAAGAVVDAATWNEIVVAGHDADALLRAHASNQALNAARALLPSAPTGTNVMDVTIALVRA